MSDNYHKYLEQININRYRKNLLRWGRIHFRHFPWRTTREPYQILIAEILLHRTQAKQVEPVYVRFIQSYPDIDSLARTSQDELMRELHTLGLHWRVELIKMMAEKLMEISGGEVPEDLATLISLPGVGPYIANAVRCFAFGHPDAIIDTNVMRVVTRIFGIPFRDSLRRNKEFVGVTQTLVDTADPRRYNFALLDLAHVLCTIQDPKCYLCPINTYCEYHGSVYQNLNI